MRRRLALPFPLTLRSAAFTSNHQVVVASKAKRSRLWDCGGGLVWIASLSLAMTIEAVRPNYSLL